jgi:hypothetical protein
MKVFGLAFIAMLFSATAFGVEANIAASGQSVSGSASTDKDQEKLIEQILTISGMEQSLKRLPEQIIFGLKQSFVSGETTPDAQKELLKIYSDAYPEDGFVNRVRDALNRNYDEKRYTHLLQLLSTPLSKRMTEIELAEPTPAAFRIFITQVASKPLSPERIQLIQRLDADTRNSAMLSKITISTIESNALAMSDDCSGNTEKIKKAIEEKRPEIETANRSSAQVMLAFTYREVSDADLAEYLKSNEDKDSKWVQDFVQAAIEDQFNSSIKKETKGMRKFVQAHRPKKTMFAPKCEGDEQDKNNVKPN